MKPIWADTCVEVWLEAVQYLYNEPECRGYNLALEIVQPLCMNIADNSVYHIVDRFLRKHHGLPLSTVAGTIFPVGHYKSQGATGVYDQYPEDYQRLKGHPGIRWGTYAIRMLRRVDSKGNVINPLKYLVEKLSKQLGRHGSARAAYELNLVDPFLDIPIYDPGSDKHYPLGGPCLSHLSFKLTADHRLLLTVLYRSHHYVQRALGNFIGLAQLQGFVAEQVGIKTGPLVCISSMAILDTVSGKWGKRDVKELIQRCNTAFFKTIPILS